jgi:hypothetical protein
MDFIYIETLWNFVIHRRELLIAIDTYGNLIIFIFEPLRCYMYRERERGKKPPLNLSMVLYPPAIGSKKYIHMSFSYKNYTNPDLTKSICQKY